jgi:hypothetical protein
MNPCVKASNQRPADSLALIVWPHDNVLDVVVHGAISNNACNSDDFAIVYCTRAAQAGQKRSLCDLTLGGPPIDTHADLQELGCGRRSKLYRNHSENIAFVLRSARAIPAETSEGKLRIKFQKATRLSHSS